jgi:hypothetical protein
MQCSKYACWSRLICSIAQVYVLYAPAREYTVMQSPAIINFAALDMAVHFFFRGWNRRGVDNCGSTGRKDEFGCNTKSSWSCCLYRSVGG